MHIRLRPLDCLVVQQKTSNSDTRVLLTYTRNDKDRGIGCMARAVTNCPILVNTLVSHWSGIGWIYITGMGGVAHAGLYRVCPKLVTTGLQWFWGSGTRGGSLSSNFWSTSCHTSSMHRALTGSNHCGNLHAGIDLSWSSSSGVRVGAPFKSIT